MKKLINQVEQYLQEALGVTVAAHPWADSGGLPQYLRERYRFFKTELLGIECLLMADAGKDEQTPAVICKHMEQIRSHHQLALVYLRDAVSSHNRKRLIGYKISFIVPGNQMYLPIFGIDLREHLKRLLEKKTLFSPSTQTLLLHVLWRKETGILTPAEIASRLGYSAMTMTRAFDELEGAGIGEHSIRGKERHLHFSETGKPLWEKVLQYLSTPVRRRLYVDSSMKSGKGSLAGQSALSRYTMLAEPKISVFAFSADEWKLCLQKDKINELTLPEPEGSEIELWKYAPGQFANEGRVDRLSLYLSLKDSTDERVQSALDDLIGGMEW
jgi:DNA-binding MarR family transcriptional regulator